MRFGFVTCVELGLSCMREIERAGGHLDLIVTLRDDLARDKAGRVWLDEFTRSHGSHLVKVANVNEPTVIEAVSDREIDWLFIIGWSQIAQKRLLATPRQGVLGMHPTLLPQGRGRASIPWAIIKGLGQTGVTLFQLDEGIDTGPIIAQERLPLSSQETATGLYQRVTAAHRTLIARCWEDLATGGLRPVPQDHDAATEWPARTPGDGRITADMTVEDVERLVRATTRPYPGAFWQGDDGRRLRIWAGRICADDDTPAEGIVVEVADGAYEALDYDWEPAPHQAASR